MDEEIKAAEGAPEATESEGNTPIESPTTEQPTEEVKAPEEEVATEPESEETETGKGAASRIKELNSKAKAESEAREKAEEKASSLEAKLAELTGQVDQGTEVPYTPQYEEGETVTPERLQQDVARAADGLVTLRIKQSEAINRINNEAKDSIRAYPQLDPDSDKFDKELSDTVTEAVEAHVRVNPYSASVSKFVSRLMKPYERAVTKGVGEATENIAKQVSEAALRPTSIRKEEKNANEKSIAELEKELGIIQA